ncbi:hypothetical protein R6Q57_008746 [Mikania cordata]
MALTCTHLLLSIAMILTLFTLGSSNPNFQKGPPSWNFDFNYTNKPFKHPKPAHNSRRIIVGGSDN